MMFAKRLLLVAMLPALAHSQPKTDSLLDLMKKAEVPGLSLVYIKNGKAVEQYALGVRSMDTKEAVDSTTIFSAASLSKGVFAFGAMKLVEQKKLDLDKPLSQYLDYPDLQHDAKYKAVTAREVLSHTSGLPNWRNDTLKFKYEPGQRFNYSGEGFVWLSRVVEKITGQQIEDYLQQVVLRPLGMLHSSYKWQKSFDTDYAFPHNDLGITMEHDAPDQANVAYSLQTTAVDYAKFVSEVLQQKGLHKKIFAQIFSSQPNSQVDSAINNVFWGLGFGLAKQAEGTSIWQWGDNGTFKGFLIAYPGKKEGLVYFANSSNGLAILKDLIKMFFGVDYQPVKWLDYTQFNSAGFQLLRRCMAMGFDEAISPYVKAGAAGIDTAKLSADELNNTGTRLMELKKYDLSQHLFSTMTKAFPQSPAAYEGLGKASMRLGQKVKAADAFKKADELAHGERKDFKELSLRLSGGVVESKDTSLVKLVFKLPDYAEANSVQVCGDFNDWSSWTVPMVWVNGEWIASVYVKRGKHAYKFCVDGVWFTDPRNKSVDVGDHLNSIVEAK